MHLSGRPFSAGTLRRSSAPARGLSPFGGTYGGGVWRPLLVGCRQLCKCAAVGAEGAARMGAPSVSAAFAFSGIFPSCGNLAEAGGICAMRRLSFTGICLHGRKTNFFCAFPSCKTPEKSGILRRFLHFCGEEYPSPAKKFLERGLTNGENGCIIASTVEGEKYPERRPSKRVAGGGIAARRRPANGLPRALLKPQ